MYAPAHNRVEDRAQRIAFMREYNFAALITGAAASGLQATHLPFIVDDDGSELRLLAHMAKANPQWRDFAGGGDALVIFAGPHAYVSPSHYQRKPSLPTWNYLAVHAYGSVRRIDGSADKLHALERLIDAHDPAFRSELAMLPSEYLDAKLAAIVAFEIAVSRVETRFKLSQERTAGERATVVAALQRSDDAQAQAQALAAKMRVDGPAA
jgi:transcriptional regulator